MFEAESAVREHIRTMEPYRPIKPFEILAEDFGLRPSEIVKLDANENPFGPPETVRRKLGELRDVHIYPDPESRLLRRSLAEFHEVPYESLLAGAGADELIDLTLRLVIDPGDALLTCPPTFGMYAFDGQLNGAEVIEVPRDENFRLDLTELGCVVEEKQPKILMLAHPNNPDGSLLSERELETVLSLPLLVLLDEAYIEFADGEASRLAEATARRNLIVVRTFSKWAGLAGLRVGYGAFPAPLLPHLWKIKQPYNVSVAASQAAVAALAAGEQLAEVGRQIVAERDKLYDALDSISYLQPYPSQANFVLCRVLGRSAADLKAELAGQGIMIRYFDKPGLRQHVRISAGAPRDTDRVIRALKKME